MTTEEKNNQFQRQIESNLLKDFRMKMSDVLSLCESPIEELMLLQLMNYFINYNSDVDEMNSFKVEFVEDRQYPWQTYTDEEDRNKLLKELKKNNYRPTPQGYAKFIGFKAESKFKGFDKIGDKMCLHEFEVYPQYEVRLNDIGYRLDIAVILNRKFYDGEIDTIKWVLECDGYDYHKDPEKFKEDKIRERALKRNGWKEVLRYSGSEIYTTGDNLEQTHYNFKEMMDIIML